MKNSEFRVEINKRLINFAVDIVKLTNSLPKTPAGFAIASQIVRSGTSIGANFHEAQSASTRKDFVNILTTCLKEARETSYWLIIISESQLMDNIKLDLLIRENDEIIRILVSIVKNSKNS